MAVPLCVLIGLLVRRLARRLHSSRRGRELDPGVRSLAERAARVS